MGYRKAQLATIVALKRNILAAIFFLKKKCHGIGSYTYPIGRDISLSIVQVGHKQKYYMTASTAF